VSFAELLLKLAVVNFWLLDVAALRPLVTEAPGLAEQVADRIWPPKLWASSHGDTSPEVAPVASIIRLGSAS
jgi:hypothetical protein